MAAKKRKSARKVQRVTKAMEKINREVMPPKLGADKCNTKEICEYLQKLSDYLVLLTADYKQVKIAVCNLDYQVWNQNGTKAKRLCTGGTSLEPPDPPVAPVW